jgi:3-hydroxyisobutyrate dehydrogenase-like beta-hydroxyacid dehydrogenase
MKIEESRIGFIGLGEVGRQLARRLIERGFHVTVYDRSAQRIEPR